MFSVDWKDEPDMKGMEKISFVDSFQPMEESGIQYYLMRSTHPPEVLMVLEQVMTDLNVFFDFPWTFSLKSSEVYIVGLQQALRDALVLLDDVSIEYEVLSLSNFHPLRNDILGSLTPLQLRYLKLAWDKGLYEIPRDTNIRKMATGQGITHTTLSHHLRKAERNILGELFG